MPLFLPGEMFVPPALKNWLKTEGSSAGAKSFFIGKTPMSEDCGNVMDLKEVMAINLTQEELADLSG
ncbi:hypothetical protein [Sinorhizobium mexicanum]|uniref:hypothetical protein n=1 Tax=Sinorhizobium mexicanum TaxID=375549 RepID=UPI0015DDDAD1|nr:hypothetical protein [Sinorhizobium mexicanum]MBP1884949.1 hypothetical protein [Sinorhizobium mexicanum]